MTERTDCGVTNHFSGYVHRETGEVCGRSNEEKSDGGWKNRGYRHCNHEQRHTHDGKGFDLRMGKAEWEMPTPKRCWRVCQVEDSRKRSRQ